MLFCYKLPEEESFGKYLERDTQIFTTYYLHIGLVILYSNIMLNGFETTRQWLFKGNPKHGWVFFLISIMDTEWVPLQLKT